MREYDCAREGCYATIRIDPKSEERLRRTKENFYCVAGHANVFLGKTEEQREIERLKRDRDSYRRDADCWLRELQDAERQRDLSISLLRQCPVCAKTPGRSLLVHRDDRFEDDLASLREWLIGHLAECHGARLVEVEEGVRYDA